MISRSDFMQKVVKKASGCWYWDGSLERMGYGQILIDKKQRPAHRIAYELFKGPIPEGMTIDHLCKRHQCVNPAHLECVSNSENTQREKARRRMWRGAYRTGTKVDYLDYPEMGPDDPT